MKRALELSPDVIWRDDGHVSDAVLAAVADGQDSLVPESASAHIEHCSLCVARVGEAALLSFDTGKRLIDLPLRQAAARASEKPAPVPGPRSTAPPAGQQAAAPQQKPPTRWIALSFAVAAIGAVPTLVDFVRWLPRLPAELGRKVPLLAKSVVLVVGTPAGEFGARATVLSFVTAILFVLIGLAIAGFLSRNAKRQGGVE